MSETTPATQQALEALEDQASVVADEIATIRGKLESCRAKFHSTGERADPAWYAKTKSALRNRGVRHQALLQQAARMRRQLRGDTCPHCHQALADSATGG